MVHEICELGSCERSGGGYNETIFGTDQEITREDMVVLLIRFADYMEMDVPTEKNPVFTDAANISSYPRDAVKRAVSAGIIGGYEDGTIRPKRTSSRAEVAKVLYGFLHG